jgi:two-component system, NarL family, response regulator NreC
VPPRTDPTESVFFGRQIRCVLMHDHVLLRQGLRRLLEDEPDFDVVDEAGNAAEGLRKVHELQPDVLVADAATFGMPAREAELLVTRESPQTKIVFLTMQDSGSSAFDDTQASAAGCTVRQTSVEELVAIVRHACSAGDPIPEDSIQETLPVRTWPQSAPRSGAIQFPPARSLTTREREVMKLLAEGKTVRSAAIVLGLSSKTVDAHKFNLMRKLGIHNKAELVMWAIQQRVVKLPANF